jgi:hypothetical protein
VKVEKLAKIGEKGQNCYPLSPSAACKHTSSSWTLFSASPNQHHIPSPCLHHASQTHQKRYPIHATLTSRVHERVPSRSMPQAMYIHPSTDTETMTPWLQSLTSCTRSCNAATSSFATTAAVAFFNLLASIRLMRYILTVTIHLPRISAMIPHVASTLVTVDRVIEKNQDSVHGVHEQQQTLGIRRSHTHGDM